MCCLFFLHSSLPFLRAAILHRLHHAAAAEPEHRLGSDTAIKLNDALMYDTHTNMRTLARITLNS